MRSWNRQGGHPARSRRRRKKRIFAVLLLLLTVFAAFRLGDRGRGMRENARRLAEAAVRQAVWWAVEFWHPPAEEPGNDQNPGRDADPSYAHYIEQKEELREYESIIKKRAERIPLQYITVEQ